MKIKKIFVNDTSSHLNKFLKQNLLSLNTNFIIIIKRIDSVVKFKIQYVFEYSHDIFKKILTVLKIQYLNFEYISLKNVNYEICLHFKLKQHSTQVYK